MSIQFQVIVTEEHGYWQGLVNFTREKNSEKKAGQVARRFSSTTFK